MSTTAGSHPYRREDGWALVEIRLHALQQLYASLDPAPFRERDLDPDAEAYVIDCIAELRPEDEVKLVIHLPAAELTETVRMETPHSVGHYFAYRLAMIERERRALLRNGWLSLMIGVGFLFACIAARELLSGFWQGPLPRILSEGLLIMGWVAMWRPLQIFLYDWWPLRRRAHLYQRAHALPIELRPVP
jgi:hypothetical protein